MLDLTLTSASSINSSGVRQPGSGEDDIDMVGDKFIAATLPSFIGTRVIFNIDDVNDVLVCDDGDLDTLRPDVRVRETDLRGGPCAGDAFVLRKFSIVPTSRATELLREFDADGVFAFNGGRALRLLSIDLDVDVIGFDTIISSLLSIESGLISRNAYVIDCVCSTLISTKLLPRSGDANRSILGVVLNTTNSLDFGSDLTEC